MDSEYDEHEMFEDYGNETHDEEGRPIEWVDSDGVLFFYLLFIYFYSKFLFLYFISNLLLLL